MSVEVFSEVKHQFLAYRGAILHNAINLFQERATLKQLSDAREGKIVRDGKILTEGKIVNLGFTKTTDENGTTHIHPMEGIYKDGYVYLCNSFAGDKIE